MNYDETLQYLLSLGHETFAIKLGLTATEMLLEALGAPHDAFAKTQIAGTNGKGSTAVMLDCIAGSAGIRTGLYTSPHLLSITERIRIGGALISEEEFAVCATTVRDIVEGLCAKSLLPAPPTFFEQVTAIALVAFRNADVQLAILETGLGGRLDATTATYAEIVAITTIALDHQEYLGNTVAAIAAEKAAIIRSGITAAAIIAPQPQEALDVIMERCRACHLTPRYDDCIVRVSDADERGRLRASFETPRDNYKDVRIGLCGRHQAINASVAIGLAEALRERGFPIARGHIVEGLEQASHAGRLEWFEGRALPAVLFDGAHNAAGARALRDYLNEFVKAPLTLIFGAMRDKDLREITSTLFPAVQRVILTQPQNPRAATLEALQQVVPRSFDSSKLMFARTAREAWKCALEVTPNDGVVCVSGSLYLVGEVKSILRAEEEKRAASAE